MYSHWVIQPLYKPLLVNITALDTDQFTGVIQFFVFVVVSLLMPGKEEGEAVTRVDLSEFRNFWLDQLKTHTSELSAKFDKATNDAESAYKSANS